MPVEVAVDEKLCDRLREKVWLTGREFETLGRGRIVLQHAWKQRWDRWMGECE